MNHARRVSRAKPVEQLQGSRSTLQRQRSPLQPLRQSLPLQEFHAQVRHAFVFSQIVDTADIGVADAPGDLYFPKKRSSSPASRAYSGAIILMATRSSNLRSKRLEYLAHSAPADKPDDFEAPGHHSPG